MSVERGYKVKAMLFITMLGIAEVHQVQEDIRVKVGLKTGRTLQSGSYSSSARSGSYSSSARSGIYDWKSEATRSDQEKHVAEQKEAFDKVNKFINRAFKAWSFRPSDLDSMVHGKSGHPRHSAVNLKPFLPPCAQPYSTKSLAATLGQASRPPHKNMVRNRRGLYYQFIVQVTQCDTLERLSPERALSNKDYRRIVGCMLVYFLACTYSCVCNMCLLVLHNAMQEAILNGESNSQDYQYDVRENLNGESNSQDYQHDVRENVLEKLFDVTPEHVKEVFSSIDRDGRGTVSSVAALREGLDKCGVSLDSELCEVTEAKVLQEAITEPGVDLEQFETIIKTLKLSQLLKRPLVSASQSYADSTKATHPMMERLMVLDYNAHHFSVQRVIDAQLSSFFLGRRSNPVTTGDNDVLFVEAPLVRWVHLCNFNLTLLLALTVKYNLHPLGVEDVIEQCPTKIDTYKKHYFLAVELLCIVGSKDGSEPLHVRGRHITMFLSRPPFPKTLVTITQSDRSFDKDWPGSNSGRTHDEKDGESWLKKLQARLGAARSRLREGHANSLAYAIIDLCADELVVVTQAYSARLAFLEEELQVKGVTGEWHSEWHREVMLARIQLRVVARRLRGLQRLVQRVHHDYGDLSIEKLSGYWRDVLDHIGEAQDDVFQLNERYLALVTAHQRAVEKEQLQKRDVQRERLNKILFILTVATTVFAPAQFIAGVYGMNFVTTGGVPAIPELVGHDGYKMFRALISVYFVLCGFCAYFLWLWLEGVFSSAPEKTRLRKAEVASRPLNFKNELRK